MPDRRAPAPVTVHNQEPPEGRGGLHTINFTGRRGKEEIFLAELGIAIGYAYDYQGVQLLSYFDGDKLPAEVAS